MVSSNPGNQWFWDNKPTRGKAQSKGSQALFLPHALRDYNKPSMNWAHQTEILMWRWRAHTWSWHFSCCLLAVWLFRQATLSLSLLFCNVGKNSWPMGFLWEISELNHLAPVRHKASVQHTETMRIFSNCRSEHRSLAGVLKFSLFTYQHLSLHQRTKRDRKRNQRFLTREQFSSRGHFAMSGNISGCYDMGRGDATGN